MNNVKKIIILIIGLVILSGCNVKSEVSINSNNSVEEKVYITENIKKINTKGTVDSYVNELIDLYGISYKDKKINKSKNTVTVILTNKYDDICKYLDNSFFANYVTGNKNCSKEKDKFVISSNVSNKVCDDCLENVDKFNINYNLNKKNILTSNGIDTGENYNWKIDVGDEKNINFEVDKKFSITYLLKGINNTVKITILFIVILVLVALFINFSYKRFKKNKIDY